MLKERLIKRILISLGAIFACFLIYLIPSDEVVDVSHIDAPKIDIKKSSIYLLDNNGMLGKTDVIVNNVDTISLANELLDILIIGGKGESSIPSGFKSLIPSDVVVNGITYLNGVLTIDFNKLFDNEYEMSIIEAIVYTMTEIKDVNGIVITIDGYPLKRLPSNIVIPNYLDRNFGINKKYEFTSLDNIKPITTYYVSKFNDDTYYVPVTKYVNDNREPIKIIIEDLTSSNTYMTNLMSFINSNTKLLETNIVDDTMELVFNSYILNDSDNILEEVINTVSLSIKDNYDVSKVIFYVDNAEIYKSVLKSLE
jgi:germination protein M